MGGEGITGKKLNDHEGIKALVAKLQELKAQMSTGIASPKASPKAVSAQSPKTAPAVASTDTSSDIEAMVKSVGDEIRTLKEKLKGEGLSGKKVNDHEDVKALVVKLQG